MLFRVLLLISLFAAPALVAQTLSVPDFHYGIDESVSMVLCRANLQTANNSHDEDWTDVRVGNRQFRFQARTQVLTYGKAYLMLDTQDREYRLYITELPLIHLEPYVWIPPDEKLPVDFTYADDEQVLRAIAGMEKRGGFTSILPKNNYDIEFWEDAEGEINRDVSFGGLRSDDDWILDAVYNEPLRVNAYVAHQLWDEVYRLPYADDDSRARAGVGVRWCEVFRQGRYDGVYFLSEQIDRKQLRLKKYNETTSTVRGALFKTVDSGDAADYRLIRNRPADQQSFWQGVEPKYPDQDGARWANLADYFTFATGASDAELNTIFNRWLDQDNLVDFFLFINLIAAEDNARKNIYYARYDTDAPYLFIPWDLDGTFGNKWNGELAGYRPDSLISNRLFDRLVALNAGGFNDAVCERFTELSAAGIYNTTNLNNRLRTQFEFLRRNGVYEREEERWPGSTNTRTAHLAYTYRWTEDRMAFFRRWFCDTSISPPAVRPTRPLTHLFPNPTSGVVNLILPDTAGTTYELRTVTGQLVTEGTFRAGDQSLDLSNHLPGLYFLRVGERIDRIVLR